ncbi:MAG TPA: redoxin domain-containing protein [Blastocatellia bacterium]|nr:redoxin domain-containing protein [Blastocatellia bacterium]
MRRVLKLLLLLPLLYCLLFVGFLTAMYQPPQVFSQIMSKTPGAVFVVLPFRPMWLHARSGRLKVGDDAPDFSLKSQDGNSTVTLSSFKGNKPVVLIFGSYT